MRFIPTSIHGVLDYLTGLMLLGIPYFFFDGVGGTPVLLARLFGLATILYSLLTRYELGIVKMIPMSAHLMIDLLSGIVLAASPWLFGFADTPTRVWLPLVCIGIFEILASLCTQTAPSTSSTATRTYSPASSAAGRSPRS